MGSHVGVTLASDGPSQMALADIAFMRAFAHVTDRHARPAITILTPSDAAGAYEMTLTMARSSGAFYLRTVRADLPILYGEDERFPLGGYKVLRNGDGEGRQVVLAASGYMVHSCLKAAAALSEDGPSVTVVDAYCLPMDAASLFALAGRNGVILTVEDTYVGGLGSELAEAAASFRNGPQVRSLVVRRMPKSGRTPDEVLDYVRLGVGDIVAAALSASRDMM